MTGQPPRSPYSKLDPQVIDALYGLEPVFEPQAGNAQGEAARGDLAATQFVAVQCPYCGEQFETLVDSSAGSASYIEDCQVCCSPIQLQLEVDASGVLAALTATRTD
jgi:Cysteine-rich CPXCG